MKRRFIVVASSLEELASQTPLLARCVSAALMVSHGLRRDSDLVLAVAGGPSIHFLAQRLRSVSPDEGSLLGVLGKALRLCREPGRLPQTAHYGVIVAPQGVEHYVLGFQHKFLLSTSGADPRSALQRASGSAAFIAPLSGEVEGEGWGAVELKLPIDKLWPDQAIALINITLDRLLAQTR